MLITGGTGFVGQALIEELLAREIQVRCAVRCASKPIDSSVEIAPIGNIGPTTDWAAAVAEIDTIVHVAGLAHKRAGSYGADENDFMRVNAGGTTSLTKAATLAGVRRMILVSTIGVNGRSSRGLRFNEDDAVHPEGFYARSKYQAEEELKCNAQGTRMEWCVVRPPVVYGPGARGTFGRLASWVKRGLPLPLGRAVAKRSFIARKNLISVLIRTMDHPSAANALFLVSDGEDLSVAELVRAMSSAIGQSARLMNVPEIVLRSLLVASGKGEDAAGLLEPLQINCSRVRSNLQWLPPITTTQAIREALTAVQ